MPVGLEAFVCRPFHQCHMLVLEFVQGHDFQPTDSGKPGSFLGIDSHRSAVALVELMQFYQQGTARLAKRRVTRTRRVAQIGTCRVIAGFIRKHAFKYQYFLTQWVLMAAERRTGPIANNAGSVPALRLFSSQWLSVYTT